MPKVTALMPLFNGMNYIRESLESVQAQTFTDWEFIIVNDYGSDDGCADVIREYAEKDPRIKLVQLEERLGLAASLNVGLDMAQGEYIARVDVDDPSEPERFAKQVAFLDEHPEVCLCSCYCFSLTKDGKHLEKVPCEPEELKASMLFPNQIRHFGTMFRLNFFNEHQLRYDAKAAVEDYELWTRAVMAGGRFANLPEILVTHRWGFGNVSIKKGSLLEEEARQHSMRFQNYVGVNTSAYAPELFSGWRAHQRAFAKKNPAVFLQEVYQLLREIYEKNEESGYFDARALKKILLQRWDWARKSSGLSYLPCEEWPESPAITTPVVSVVLPTFCSAEFISKAIDSVLTQTFTDWELLVINDFGSYDGTAELVEMYAWADPRIRLIQADRRLGLAESLNLGIREARGKYIARLDADDTALPERFAKQVAYMDAHPEVGVCGTWQQHYGKDREWVHKADPDPKRLRCKLLFWCDLCHSTLMLRRSVFIEHQLFYDPHAKAEDFELWTRAMEYTELTNIPEVLGTYNESTGITNNKLQELATESGEITERTIQRLLGIRLEPGDCRLLNGWINPISGGENRNSELARLREILTEIWEKNESTGFFDSHFLVQILAAKWFWAKDHVDWKQNDYRSVRKIEDAFSNKFKPSLRVQYQNYRKNNPRFTIFAKKTLKRLFRPVARFSRRVIRALFKDAIEEINKDIERWTWERYQRLSKKSDTSANFINSENPALAPYNAGEKIRMLFLFQAASFWPSWESFYESCVGDERIEVVFAWLDEEFGDTTQMKTAKQFLESKQIPFVIYSDLLLAELQPHVLILQTPYDEWHRQPHVRSDTLRQKGVRLVYIPYGIEIADTNESYHDQFDKAVLNCWRIYTFSERMRLDYMIHCKNGLSARGIGHPKFDGLFFKEKLPLPAHIQSCRNGRKLVLWHVHFPKLILMPDKSYNMVTPRLEEYLLFLEYIKSHNDLYFIFQPHPKFLDCKEPLNSMARELFRRIEKLDNVFIDRNDDYRGCLVNSECIISDRSAVMIEAATVNVPVLYLSNPDYFEPMNAAVAPLVESYEQGQTCEDMIAFVERCRQGLDVNREQRNAAFRECIPFFDGKCGERIKEDIVRSLEEEREQTMQFQLSKQTAQLEERIARLEVLMDARMESQSRQIDKSVERWTWERYKRIRTEHEELRRQNDFDYRDIMVVLEKQLDFIGKHDLVLLTEHPIAVESLDTRYPHGTVRDNTRFPRFIKKCETLLGKDQGLSFLDLGCSGGGMVLDAILRGHLGIGLEGCDASLLEQRAEWRLLRNNLFTCDISKPFVLLDKSVNQTKQFDIITAWEVLEHIEEKDLPMLFSNIHKHLSSGGLFIASIANYEDVDPESGVNWHVTMHPYEWWKEQLENADFTVCSDLLDTADLARGGYNPPNVYQAASKSVNHERCFHIAAKKKPDNRE